MPVQKRWAVVALAIIPVAAALALSAIGVSSLRLSTTELFEHPWTAFNAAFEARLELAKMHQQEDHLAVAQSMDERQATWERLCRHEANALAILRSTASRDARHSPELRQAIEIIEQGHALRVAELDRLNSGDGASARDYLEADGAFLDSAFHQLEVVAAAARSEADDIGVAAVQRAIIVGLGGVILACLVGAWLASLGTRLMSARRRNKALIELTGAVVALANDETHFGTRPPARISEFSELAGAIAILRDALAAKKELHDRLLRSEERFRVFQELSLDGFVIVEAIRRADGTILDFRWLYANPSALHQLGVSDEALGRMTVVPLLSKTSSPNRLFDLLRRVVDTEQPETFETYFNSGGISAWFRGVLVKLGDGAACSLADISDMKRAQLAKSSFLAAASHDLRQPFQALRLFLTALEGRMQHPKDKELVEKSFVALGRGEDLLNALMDISAIEAGIVRIQPRDISAEGVLAWCRHEFAGQAAAKGLTLRVVSSSAAFISDEVQLRRILGNLIVNAIKFTKHGTILVGCRRRPDALYFQVLDTGPGIPSDKAALVFEEFFQLDNPERDRQKGLGLGLSIALRMAKVLGHELSLRSEVGRGSAFTLRVPYASSDARRHEAAEVSI